MEEEFNAADILQAAADTFRDRNALYKDNAIKVGELMAVLFPDGVRLHTPEEFHKWHLFELMMVKLTRFVNSDMTHEDSIRDLIVYGAMVEKLTHEENEVRVTNFKKSNMYTTAVKNYDTSRHTTREVE